MAQGQAAQHVKLLVGIVDVVQLVYQPGVAVGIGVLQGHALSALQGQYEVLGVEHVQHGVDGVALHLRHIAGGTAHGSHHTGHLLGEIGVDQLLVAAQLGSMVAADALQVVRRLVLVERRRGQIQRAEVERLVLQDMVDGGRLVDGCLTDTLRDEHAVVQIALVDLPHVDEAEQRHGCGHPRGLQLAITEEQQQHRAGHDNPERPPAVGSEHGDAHVGQVLGQRGDILLRKLAQGLHLVIADKVGEEHLRHQGKQQAHATGEGEGNAEGGVGREELADSTGRLARRSADGCRVEPLLQGQHGEQGYGKLGYDQYGGHRAELGVHGDIVDEEVGQRHEVTSPRQQHRQDGDGQQGPLHGSLYDKQSQHEEHQHEGAHIDGAGRHGLIAPVLAHLLVDAGKLVVGLGHSRLAVSQRCRRAALCVRHEQRPRLVQAVAPLRDVVAVQPGGRLAAAVALDQLALAAHGLLTVLPRVVEVREVQRYAYSRTGQTHGSSLQQVLVALTAQGVDGKGDDHGQNDKQVVVGHLHVVGQYLQRREEGRDDQSPQVLAPIGQHHAANHGRQVGQGHDLPDVAGGNDDEEVAREGPHHRTEHGQIPAEVEGTQQQVEA